MSIILNIFLSMVLTHTAPHLKRDLRFLGEVHRMGTFGGPQGARGQDFVSGGRGGGRERTLENTHTHTKTTQYQPGSQVCLQQVTEFQ